MVIPHVPDAVLVMVINHLHWFLLPGSKAEPALAGRRVEVEGRAKFRTSLRDSFAVQAVRGECAHPPHLKMEMS